MQKKCLYCGTDFYTDNQLRKFCSDSHRVMYSKGKKRQETKNEEKINSKEKNLPLEKSNLYAKILLFAHLMKYKGIIFTPAKISSYSHYFGVDISYGNNYSSNIKNLVELGYMERVYFQEKFSGGQRKYYKINYFNLANFMFDEMHSHIDGDLKVKKINLTEKSLLTSKNEYKYYLANKLEELFDEFLKFYIHKDKYYFDALNSSLDFTNLSIKNLIQAFAQYLYLEQNDFKEIYKNILPVVYFYLLKNNIFFSFENIFSQNLWEEISK